MSKIKNIIADKAELAMTGRMIVCDLQSTSEAQAITDYILNVLGINRHIDVDVRINQYVQAGDSRYEVYGLLVNTIEDMFVISYILKKNKYQEAKLVHYDDNLFYVSSWCENLSYPDFSELGDIFLEKQCGFYHRVA